MNIEKTHVSDNGVSFVIMERLKTTKKTIRPKIIECISSEIPALNVCDYVIAYLNRTLAARASQVSKGFSKPTQLFISWATKKPVTRATLARWLKHTLKLAGIDTDQFKAHSYRGAGLSAACAQGASIQQIVAAGNWTNTDTFRTHYHAPETTSAVGKIILQHFVGVSTLSMVYFQYNFL